MSITRNAVVSGFTGNLFRSAFLRVLGSLILVAYSITVNDRMVSAESLSAAEQKVLLEQAEKLGEAFEKGDADYIIAKTHPSLSGIMGGKEKFENLTRTTMTQLESLNVEFIESSLGTPTQTYPSDDEVVCFVPKNSLIKVGEKKVKSKGFLIAARPASGGDWLFLDGAGLRKNPQMLWKLFPKLAKDIELPENTQEIVE